MELKKEVRVSVLTLVNEMTFMPSLCRLGEGYNWSNKDLSRFLQYQRLRLADHLSFIGVKRCVLFSMPMDSFWAAGDHWASQLGPKCCSN